MAPNFQFRIQAFQILFDAKGDFLTQFSGQIDKDPNAPFRRRQSPGPERQIFFTKTGGTQVTVEMGAISGQTRYFDSFVDTKAWTSRRDYTMQKLEYLLRKVEETNARLLLTALTTIAHAPSPKTGIEKDRYKADAWKALGLESSFGYATPVDFAIRGGRKFGEKMFLATSVNWYQRRTFSFAIPPVPTGRTGSIVMRDWEGQVDEEGLECRIDLNNKAGLIAGDLAWTADKVITTLGEGLAELPSEFSKIERLLQSNMGPQ